MYLKGYMFRNKHSEHLEYTEMGSVGGRIHSLLIHPLQNNPEWLLTRRVMLLGTAFSSEFIFTFRMFLQAVQGVSQRPDRNKKDNCQKEVLLSFKLLTKSDSPGKTIGALASRREEGPAGFEANALLFWGWFWSLRTAAGFCLSTIGNQSKEIQLPHSVSLCTEVSYKSRQICSFAGWNRA